MKRGLLFSAAFLSAFSVRAAFEPLGEGAVAKGVGGAYTAGAEDSSTPYWNPAALALLKGRQAGAATEDVGGLRLLRYSAVGYTQANLGGGAVGFNFLRLQTMGDASYLNYAENTYLAAYGRPWFGGLCVGAGVRYYAVAGPQKATALGVDGALMYRSSGKNFRAAAVVQDLNRPHLHWATGAVDEIPLQVRGALFWRTGPFGDFFAEEDWRRGEKQTARLGAAIYFMNRALSLRAGGHKSQKESSTGFSVGGGVKVKSLTIDYAWDQNDQDDTQIFSLGWRFGP
jgi:hypothetical protein